MPAPSPGGFGPSAALLALLAGCSQPPVAEPLLTLARADCDARPDFTAALPVRADTMRGATATLEASGRCLARPGAAPTTYAAFVLPTEQATYTLDIVSQATARAVVRPVATLYDAAGKLVRTLPPEEFETTIGGLRAGVRTHGTERWLVVAADQTRLGQVLQMQLGGSPDGRVQTAAVIIVPTFVIPPPTPDLVRQRSAVFSLNGTITVFAAPARTVQVAANDPAR